MELIARLQGINSGLAEAGIPAQVGVMLIRDGDKNIIYSFALAGAPRGDEAPMKLDDGTTSLSYVNFAIIDLTRQPVTKGKKGSKARGTPPKVSVRSKNAQSVIANIPKGSIMIRKASDRAGISDGGKCSGAYIVRLTAPTTSGWGPLLYDLAMEHASRGSGLTSDRYNVTSAASNVWNMYATSRPDVVTQQLDVPSGYVEKDPKQWGKQLTPEDESDDCGQLAAQSHAGGKRAAWRKSHLSRVYKKSDRSVTSALKAAGLLWQ
jgi:hypothetical protein